MRTLFVAAAILSTVCADAFGQAYRWVDQEGRVHYTQTPPPPNARNVQRKSFRGGGVDVSNLPYATQLAAKNFPVTLYTQPDCGAPCEQARALLVRRAVPFREVSVVTQKDADEMKRLSGKSDLPIQPPIRLLHLPRGSKRCERWIPQFLHRFRNSRARVRSRRPMPQPDRSGGVVLLSRAR